MLNGISPEFEELLRLFDHLRDNVSRQHGCEIDVLLTEIEVLRSQLAAHRPRKNSSSTIQSNAGSEASGQRERLRKVAFVDSSRSSPKASNEKKITLDRTEEEDVIPKEDIHLELLQPHSSSFTDDVCQPLEELAACRLDLPHRRIAEAGCIHERLEKFTNGGCKDNVWSSFVSGTLQNGVVKTNSGGKLSSTVPPLHSDSAFGEGSAQWKGSESAPWKCIGSRTSFLDTSGVRYSSQRSCYTNAGAIHAQHFQLLEFWKQYNDLSRLRVDEVIRDWCGAGPIMCLNRSSDPKKYLKRVSTNTAGGMSTGQIKKWRDNMSDDPQFFFAIEPYSKVRLAWVFLSLVLLAVDSITVPLTTCFDIPFSSGMIFFNLAECCFWTIDIVFSFFTGVSIDGQVHLELAVIACYYLKGWFSFDILIVGLDWLMVILEGIDDTSPFRYLRNFRWMRAMRVLRVLRFARIFKLKMFVSEIIVLSSDGLNVTVFYFKATLLVLLGSHVSACLWHLLGSSLNNGWVHVNGYAQDAVFYKYLLALRWVASHLQGVGSGDGMKTDSTVEIALDVFALVICLIVVSFYIGIATHAIIINRSSDASKTKSDALQFARRHEIPRAVYHRMLKFLSAHRVSGPGELLRAESRLLSIFPRALQEDLLFETRTRFLRASSFLEQIHSTIPRVLRHLCFEAIEDVLAVESDVVFAANDVCGRMLFIRSGEFKYNLDRYSRASGFSKDSKGSMRGHLLVKGDSLCEACLWTHWFHCGSLIAQRDSLLLALSSAKFGNVITQQRSACVFAVKYARAFVRELNLETQTDLARMDIAFHELDDGQFAGTAEDHLFFISHYKQEAGTEATLIRDALEILLQTEQNTFACDLQSPVFIDSEDLVDLGRLRFHVEGSKALLLLLTPGVLYRPWCLLEVCSAHRSGVQILPVEVQRPGMKYEYPDDEFYRRLHRREILDHEGHQLLESQGVTLQMLDDAIRHVFLKIALPFSPHKSGNVRQAELLDIMRRSMANSNVTRASRFLTSELAFSARSSARPFVI